ncbi:hypothetical protein PUN28_016235 [Cardiocondyla obscurior]|uniref:Uncharacterized protein n=1 Tax=Cardiocondyla obscurior TaxID=286306 RepID=A0AAW2ERI9_9HYME
MKPVYQLAKEMVGLEQDADSLVASNRSRYHKTVVKQ